ncbi:MAG: DUF951 domain-containing protein [Ruminococcaceae bacterium]|nr:DUF951 domain-containing protein [Oscillospiraceae bacterium]
MTKIIKISLGDILEMKKPHPCGENRMKVLRVGSDIRIKCEKCSRDVTVARIKLEKNIKRVISAESSVEK